MRCRLLLKYKVKNATVTQILPCRTKAEAEEKSRDYMIGQTRLFEGSLTGILQERVIVRDRKRKRIRKNKEQLAKTSLYHG